MFSPFPMNCREEQEQEIEALGYIYQENEIEFISENEIKIYIQKDDPELDLVEALYEEEYYEGEEERPIWLLSILFSLPSTYPLQEVPALTVKSIFLDQQEIDELVEKGLNQCRESLGDAMMYNIACFLKEEAESLIKARIAKQEKELELEKEQENEKERIKYQGSKVTKESFLEWQRGFIAEAKATLKAGKQPLSKAFIAALAVEKLIESSSKLTGKQLFERDQALNVSDAQYGDEEGQDVEIDASLLHGMQHIDLEEHDSNSVLAGLTED